MIYELEFLPDALREWRKLDNAVRKQLQSKLRERLNAPRLDAASLRGMRDHYKIKLRSSGYRLVYRVDDKRIVVVVVAVGRRDRGQVYDKAMTRLE